MILKWKNCITNIYILILPLLLSQQFNFMVIEYRSDEPDSGEKQPILSECTTPEDEDGYCVQIYNCLSLLQTSDITSINKRRCGPSNENKTKPRVCCESQNIQFMHNIFLNSGETCGLQNVSTSSRIFGGETALPGEFPWMARLLRRNRRGDLSFSCTGALINSKTVVTTAHCLMSNHLDKLGNLYAVGLGDHETQCSFGNRKCAQRKKIAEISRYISHSGYDSESSNHDNDIGLIFLKEPVAMTDFISPICILTEAYITNVYYISGWGKTENGTISTVKRKLSLPPYSWEQCSNKYKTLNISLTANHLCAGGIKHEDSCQGDSGGPLMVLKDDNKWFIAGVVSFGVGCGREGWPGIYTYIPNYVRWIKNQFSGQ